MRDRLYRSSDDRVIGGVAGGVAESLDIDPSIVRVVWVILAFLTGGLAAVVYLVMLIVVPEAPDDEWERVGAADVGAPAAPATGEPVRSFDEPATTSEQAADVSPAATAPPARPPSARSRRRDRSEGGALVFGVILILVGGYFLVRQYVPAIDLDLIWPIVVIGLGALLVFGAIRPGGPARR